MPPFTRAGGLVLGEACVHDPVAAPTPSANTDAPNVSAKPATTRLTTKRITSHLST
jgi:hypothetical protein